ADREMVLRHAEHVPQSAPRAGEPLDHTEAASAVVRPDRLRAVACDDVLPAGGDLAERLVPGDPREPSLALSPRPPHRIEEPARVPRVLEEVIDLHAQRAPRVRMRAIAHELHGAAFLHRHHPAARVGTVERADTRDLADGGISAHASDTVRSA